MANTRLAINFTLLITTVPTEVIFKLKINETSIFLLKKIVLMVRSFGLPVYINTD